MELLKAQDLACFGGGELLFEKDILKIHQGDRIGLIGKNGSGKSTLLQVLKGNQIPDRGSVTKKSDITYLDQGLIQKLPLSGGEEKKRFLFHVLQNSSPLLFLDEPDNHLDTKGLHYLIQELRQFPGAFLMVSHNRFILNHLCTQIWEIENKKITVYSGNFQEYENQKEQEQKSEEKRYQEYQKNKKQLTRAIQKMQKQSARVKNTPSRMGNSEARLHKMGDQRAKKNLSKAAGRIETRLEQLEKIPKPSVQLAANMDLPPALKIHSPYVIQGDQVFKKRGEHTILESICFALQTGSKTALIGENGSGKTTFLEMIRHKETSIVYQKSVRVGYLGQFFELPDQSITILDQVNQVTLYDPAFTRLILARLLFRDSHVYKKCRDLSGGELTKVSLAMLILGNYNVLLLDEPINHLDLLSTQAVENALLNYQGTVLFTSHDPVFIQKVASEVWEIKNRSLSIVP